jgi:hypothetical protein
MTSMRLADTAVAHQVHPAKIGADVTASVISNMLFWTGRPKSAIVQHGLQHLAKPWNRRRVMEVFRDETSLTVSRGLWPSIRAALDASRWFVPIGLAVARGRA